jgi:ribosomal protein S18 acetylase RimI-like enzyme
VETSYGGWRYPEKLNAGPDHSKKKAVMTSQAESFINLKAAQPENASQIAPLMIEAGGGFYEFLFEGLGLESGLLQFLNLAISADEGAYSWKNCLVAERGGHFAGFANAFPAWLLHEQDFGSVPQERFAHLAPVNEIMDWESFFLSSIAVLPSDRGHGVGHALLEGILTKAMQLGFQNVTLQVWEENNIARKLYERHGFAVARTAILAPHSMLPDTPSLLMRRELAKD